MSPLANHAARAADVAHVSGGDYGILVVVLAIVAAALLPAFRHYKAPALANTDSTT